MDLSTIVGLKELDIDKETFLSLIEEEARRSISDIVDTKTENSSAFYRGRLSALKLILMRATKNRVSINNLGEFVGTDATDWT